MNIVFDIDGVTRDLNGGISDKYNIPPTVINTWHWSYKGKNIFHYINQELSILELCPPTEYYGIIKKHCEKPEFWSSQPRPWIEYTKSWLDKHFKQYDLIIFENPVQKFNHLTQQNNLASIGGDERTLLIEDYPGFPDYTQIILVDRLYNRSADAKMRISQPAQLAKLLKANRRTDA